MAQVSSELGPMQWLNNGTHIPAVPRKMKVDPELERLKVFAAVPVINTKSIDQPLPSLSASLSMSNTPIMSAIPTSTKDDSPGEQQRQSSPISSSTTQSAKDPARTRARTLSGSSQTNCMKPVEESNRIEHDLLHMFEGTLKSTPNDTPTQKSTPSPPLTLAPTHPTCITTPESEIVIEPDKTCSKEYSLEEQLKNTQKELEICQRQLREQDQQAQQTFASCLADKEQESSKVRKLLHIVTLQEQLIHSLETHADTPESSRNLTLSDVDQLVAQFAKLLPEKDRLQDNLLSLRGELEIIHRQMQLLMLVSTETQNAFDAEKSRLEERIETLTHKLQYKGRLNEVSERRHLPIDHEVTQRSPIIEERVALAQAATKRNAGPPTRMYEPVENPNHRSRRTSTSTFSSSNTESSGAGSLKPAHTKHKSLRQSQAPQLQSAAPPPTPPPSEPLPPLPSALQPFDKYSARMSSHPRSRPVISSTPPTPRIMVKKHNAVDNVADGRPSFPPFPYYHPSTEIQPFESQEPLPSPALPLSHNTSSHSWYDDDDRSSHSDKEQHAAWTEDPDTTTPHNEKSPFWKGMKKKWMIR